MGDSAANYSRFIYDSVLAAKCSPAKQSNIMQLKKSRSIVVFSKTTFNARIEYVIRLVQTAIGLLCDHLNTLNIHIVDTLILTIFVFKQCFQCTDK